MIVTPVAGAGAVVVVVDGVVVVVVDGVVVVVPVGALAEVVVVPVVEAAIACCAVIAPTRTKAARVTRRRLNLSPH